jgi:hypothetical protein
MGYRYSAPAHAVRSRPSLAEAAKRRGRAHTSRSARGARALLWRPGSVRPVAVTPGSSNQSLRVMLRASRATASRQTATR